jgi:hypothetical protein
LNQKILDSEMHWYCEDNDNISASYLSENLPGEMLRHCEDNAYIVIRVSGYHEQRPEGYQVTLRMLDLDFVFYRLLERLYSTLRVGYNSGRKITASRRHTATLFLWFWLFWAPAPFPVLFCVVPIRKSGWGICTSVTSLVVVVFLFRFC